MVDDGTKLKKSYPREEGFILKLSSLEEIPHVSFGNTCPVKTPDGEHDASRPSVDARIELRRNLFHYKVSLVNDIVSMLKASPPVDPLSTTAPPSKRTLSPREREDIANYVADWYIKSVDSFLTNHYGAAPSQGMRWPWQNEFNHPWCDDVASSLEKSWAERLTDKVAIGSQQVKISQVIKVDRVQYHSKGA